MASPDQMPCPSVIDGGENLLAGLPAELIASTVSCLPNRDLKSLRLTCQFFRATVKLRPSRVFISANQRDIEVCNTIANHDVLCKRITEIVWDDAMIPGPTQRGSNGFEKVISTRADAAALRHALTHFPSLRTITITPAAHGALSFPLYGTPTIHTFPPGFNYPIPRGWPATGEEDSAMKMPPWIDEAGGGEDNRDRWREFCLVMCTLALHASEHTVSELILDAHQLDTGLNYRIFEQLCPEYRDFVALLRRPGFRALGEIGPDLKHISLNTDMRKDMENWAALVLGDESMPHHFPLRVTVFPMERWSNLRHFGLSGFRVTHQDLFSLLSALPSTMRSLELGNLYFLDKNEHWRGLLDYMRDRLGWRDRPADTRPCVSIYFGEIDGQRRPGRAIWLDSELAEYLYADGQCSFGTKDGRFPGNIDSGKGVVRDAFDLCYEMPTVGLPQLMQMGFLKPASLFPRENQSTSS
ncbi:hypothetical protein GQ53DRAFT_798904 [Thozetella sp. PMI_491]|nr:hypothetical protein GQ53DRAFT_798904 [Thozetella sp. PMI_491]